jgi:predicted pyridoxine 5'-phosphate oxidase superfamily flavin-nucleotide-binding protein
MAGLTDEIRAAVDRAVLCWLATADADGQPNVSPKEVFAALGDDLVIAHIASPRSVRNVRVNPRVCVSVLEVFEQRGWKLTGRATIVEPADPAFTHLAAPLEAITEGGYPIRAIFRVAVEHAEPIVAPSSWLYPDRDPAVTRAGVLRRYGVVEPEG